MQNVITLLSYFNCIWEENFYGEALTLKAMKEENCWFIFLSSFYRKGLTKEPSGRYNNSTSCCNLTLAIILQEKHFVYSMREVSLKLASIYLRFYNYLGNPWFEKKIYLTLIYLIPFVFAFSLLFSACLQPFFAVLF